MRTVGPQLLLSWLRAAAEASRLRLLGLCADHALSVSDLADALHQSEPRVSRHLKILCEAGLLERLRHGQWVHYRLCASAEEAGFVRGLIAQLDRGDPLLMHDRAQVRAITSRRSGAAATESRLGRALAALLGDAASSAPADNVLVVGVDHPEVLERAARGAGRCTALARTRRAAQGARAYAERSALACRIVQVAGSGGVGGTDLARAGSSFDLVLLDDAAAGAAGAVGAAGAAGAASAAGAAGLSALLRQARGVLAPHGRLWVFEAYDSLEIARGRVVEHPLARLRRLLKEAGLECERITPVEADGLHVLASVAHLAGEPASPAQPAGAQA